MNFRHSRGFTMVELISAMVIVAVLAVTAMPRLNAATGFDAAAFRDQAIAAFRYAQKTSTSHRRLVCTTLTQTSIALSIDSSTPKTSACNAALPIPGVAAQPLSAKQSGFTTAPTPSVLYFQPNGRVTSDISGATIANFDNTIDGNRLVIKGATGYVGDGT